MIITIGNTAYGQCPHCLNWAPVEEMGWDTELLAWTCYPSCPRG